MAPAGQAGWAWVSLDAGDNDPARFWTYVVAAIQAPLGRDVGGTSLALLASLRTPPVEIVLTELLNDIAAAGDACTLVFDDYHVIENPEIHRGLDFMLGNLPPNLRLLIASRQTPPLALPLLRGRRRLLEIGPQDLRFTEEEAAIFLNQLMGLDLSAEQVAMLEAHTEGWVAGLQLAALRLASPAMRGAKDIIRFVRSFSGGHRFVFDYLSQEVLERQSHEMRAFLLQTSILDRMCGDLCDAIVTFSVTVSNGQAILEDLDTANLFVVPLDQERHWYRYHHLFAEFLRAHLAEQYDAATVAALHRRASAWYREQGLAEEALAHALAAADYNRAETLARPLPRDLFRRSNLPTVIDWFRKWDAGDLAARPALTMCLAWALLAMGQFDEAESRLQDIEQAIGAPVGALDRPQDLAPTTRAALVEVATLRSNLAVHHFDFPAALGLARQALDNLAGDEGAFLFNPPASLRPAILYTLAASRELLGQTKEASVAFAGAAALAASENNSHILVSSFGHLAQLQTLQGQLHQAAATCRRALEDSRVHKGRPTPMGGIAHAGLGNVLYEWNDLSGAEAELREAIEVSRWWRNLEGLLLGHLGLARVHRARGEWKAGLAVLQEIEDLCRRLHMPALLPSVAAARARLAYERGDLSAVGWAAGCGLTAESEPAYLREGEALVLARALLMQGRIVAAERLLAGLLAAAETGGRQGRAIEILALQAVAAQAAGRLPEAMDTLGRALSAAEPQGFMRTFLDEGAAMTRLLAHLTGRPPEIQAYVARLAAAAVPAPASTPAPAASATPRAAALIPRRDALRTRDRSPFARCRRTDQPGDRRSTLRFPQHRQDPPQDHLRQAQRLHPHPGPGPRPPVGAAVKTNDAETVIIISPAPAPSRNNRSPCSPPSGGTWPLPVVRRPARS